MTMQQMLLGYGGVSMPEITYAIIGGGAKGESLDGSGYHGGGGGGEVLTGTFTPTSGTTYTITVGGTNTDSSISSVATANAGEQGVNIGDGGDSGSGNSGGTSSYTGGMWWAAGGGGGQTAAGQNASFNQGGNGGAGTGITVGTNTNFRCGGGGGGRSDGTGGTGVDGGGNGGSPGGATNATANTGGGGGGDVNTGGSGRVVLRYSNSFDDATSVTGTTKNSLSGITEYDFTGSGSITF